MMTQEQCEAKAVGKIPSEMRKQRPAPNGQALPVGRAKGTPNRLTVALKDAVERAARDCHPQGLAGWLVDRANGSIGDRQIFAAVVSKVIPLQIQQHVQGGISINLNWLGGRQIGTVAAQTVEHKPQVVDLIEQSDGSHQIVDQHTQQQAAAPEAVGAPERAGT